MSWLWFWYYNQAITSLSLCATWIDLPFNRVFPLRFKTAPHCCMSCMAQPCLSRPLGTSEPGWIAPSPRVCTSWGARAAWGGGGGRWQRVCVCVPLSNYPCLSCCIEVRSCVTDSPGKSFHLMRCRAFWDFLTRAKSSPHPHPSSFFFIYPYFKNK